MRALRLLAVDTGSPVVSVAVVAGDRVLAVREGRQRESSARLIGWIEDALDEAGAELRDLDGAVALRGPGSFTGLRVGLATLLGFHLGIGLRVTGLPTLFVLAATAPAGAQVMALVPAGPGEWFAQRFTGGSPPRPLAEPRRRPADLPSLAAEGVDRVVVATADERQRLGGGGALPVAASAPLASVAGRLAACHGAVWDPALLVAPLYLAPAPVTPPGPPKPVWPVEDPGQRR